MISRVFIAQNCDNLWKLQLVCLNIPSCLSKELWYSYLNSPLAPYIWSRKYGIKKHQHQQSTSYISLKLCILGAMELEFEVWPTSCCVTTICLCLCLFLINVPISTCFSVLFPSICFPSVSKVGPYLGQVRTGLFVPLVCSHKTQKSFLYFQGCYCLMSKVMNGQSQPLISVSITWHRTLWR